MSGAFRIVGAWPNDPVPTWPYEAPMTVLERARTVQEQRERREVADRVHAANAAQA